MVGSAGATSVAETEEEDTKAGAGHLVVASVMTLALHAAMAHQGVQSPPLLAVTIAQSRPAETPDSSPLRAGRPHLRRSVMYLRKVVLMMSQRKLIERNCCLTSSVLVWHVANLEASEMWCPVEECRA